MRQPDKIGLKLKECTEIEKLDLSTKTNDFKEPFTRICDLGLSLPTQIVRLCKRSKQKFSTRTLPSQSPGVQWVTHPWEAFGWILSPTFSLFLSVLSPSFFPFFFLYFYPYRELWKDLESRLEIKTGNQMMKTREQVEGEVINFSDTSWFLYSIY